MAMTAPLPERVYCAGPFNPLEWASTPFNISRAVDQSQRVRALGFVPVCPHVTVFPGCKNEEAAMQECFSHLDTCDVLVLLEDWIHSKGTLLEKERAEQRGLLVYESLDALRIAKADELPVTLNGLLRVLWFHLAQIIEKECRAGMQPPALLPDLWHHRLGLFECWLNGHAEPRAMFDKTKVPPLGLVMHHCGTFMGSVSQVAAGIREGYTARFRDFVKATRNEAAALGAVIQ